MAFTCDYQATPMPSPTLRTTLGTQLARAGVAPQITQRIMRHADFRTTNRHYTVLGLADTAAAIDSLPGIDRGRTRPRTVVLMQRL